MALVADMGATDMRCLIRPFAGNVKQLWCAGERRNCAQLTG
jgi:hypothetical protein